MDDTWIKAIVISIGAFLSSVLGIKVALAKTQTKLDLIEKSNGDRFDSMEKSFESQFKNMGREIGEVKSSVKGIHDDIYKTKFDQ